MTRDEFLAVSDERDTWMAWVASAAAEAARRAWQLGYEQGWRDRAEQKPPAAPRLVWGEPYPVMEERRYGPMPDGFADPACEEHPGMARRRARAAVPRPGDFQGRGRKAA